jgi:hypothetical protein
LKQITLTQGKITLVDDADFESLSIYKCHALRGRWNKGTWYARANVGGKQILLHRLILGDPPPGMEVDHIDGDGLNNQRSNLRFCTKSENMQNRKLQRNNTSGYRGVVFHKPTKKWQATISFQGKTRWLGLFVLPEEAAAAYDREASRLFGEFARLNGLDP